MLYHFVQLGHHLFYEWATHIVIAVKVHIIEDGIHSVIVHVAAISYGNRCDSQQFSDLGGNGSIACRRCQLVGKYFVQKVAIAQQFWKIFCLGQVCRQHLFLELAQQVQPFQTQHLACQWFAHHQKQGVRDDDMLFIGVQGKHPVFRSASFLQIGFHLVEHFLAYFFLHVFSHVLFYITLVNSSTYKLKNSKIYKSSLMLTPSSCSPMNALRL